MVKSSEETIKLSTGAVVLHPKHLNDQILWKLRLKPIEVGMPQDVKDYLRLVEKEFNKRKIKLRPIVSAKPM